MLKGIITGVDNGKLTEEQQKFAGKKLGFDLGEVTKDDLSKIRTRAEATLHGLENANFVKATVENVKAYFKDAGRKFESTSIGEGGAFVFADDSKHRVFIESGFFDKKHNSPLGRTNLLIHEASHFDFRGLNGTGHPSFDPFGSGARDRFINGAYRFSGFVTGSQ